MRTSRRWRVVAVTLALTGCKTSPQESEIAGVWVGVADCVEWETELGFVLAESEGVVTGTVLSQQVELDTLAGTWTPPKLYFTWPPGYELDGVFENDTIKGKYSERGVDDSCDAVLWRCLTSTCET